MKSKQQDARPLEKSDQVEEAWQAGHFYSAIPDFGELLKNLTVLKYDRQEIPGINLNVEKQLSVLRKLASHSQNYFWPREKSSSVRYYQDNPVFGQGSGFFLYAMIREYEPNKIIEVGSGFSSALMLDLRERFNLKLDLLFVEPYPEVRLEKLLRNEADGGYKSIRKDFVQNISSQLFESLDKNDILFIDSSHVAKTGSDVVYLLTEIIPKLKSGVLVHIHDIYWPFEYPVGWLRKKWAWNEAHFLKALLQNNSKLEILLFVDFMKKFHYQEFSNFPFSLGFAGSSFWMRIK